MRGTLLFFYKTYRIYRLCSEIFIDIRAGGKRGYRSVRRGGGQLTDLFAAAISCNKNSFTGSFATFVCRDIAVLIEGNKIFEFFIVGNLSDRNKQRADPVFFNFSVFFVAKPFEFIRADIFRKRSIRFPDDVLFRKQRFDQAFVAEKPIEKRINVHFGTIA